MRLVEERTPPSETINVGAGQIHRLIVLPALLATLHWLALFAAQSASWAGNGGIVANISKPPTIPVGTWETQQFQSLLVLGILVLLVLTCGTHSTWWSLIMGLTRRPSIQLPIFALKEELLMKKKKVSFLPRVLYLDCIWTLTHQEYFERKKFVSSVLQASWHPK